MTEPAANDVQTTRDEASGSADEASGSADEASGSADEASGSADETSGSADEASSSADEAVRGRQEQPGVMEVEDAIAAMHAGAEQIKRDELETAITKLESRGSLTEEQREGIEAMADALVSTLLAPPTESLRAAAASDEWDRVDAALDLFERATAETPGPSPADPSLRADSDGGFGAEPATGRVDADDSTSG